MHLTRSPRKKLDVLLLVAVPILLYDLLDARWALFSFNNQFLYRFSTYCEKIKKKNILFSAHLPSNNFIYKGCFYNNGDINWNYLRNIIVCSYL